MYLYMNFKFVRWRETNLKFKRLSATLYLFLQAVADSMAVAVTFPDFPGFLAFRAPNIGFPKSGSNGSFSRADIPRTDIDPRNMSSRTKVLCWGQIQLIGSDSVLNSDPHTGSEFQFCFWLWLLQCRPDLDLTSSPVNKMTIYWTNSDPIHPFWVLYLWKTSVGV